MLTFFLSLDADITAVACGTLLLESLLLRVFLLLLGSFSSWCSYCCCPLSYSRRPWCCLRSRCCFHPCCCWRCCCWRSCCCWHPCWSGVPILAGVFTYCTVHRTIGILNIGLANSRNYRTIGYRIKSSICQTIGYRTHSSAIYPETPPIDNRGGRYIYCKFWIMYVYALELFSIVSKHIHC